MAVVVMRYLQRRKAQKCYEHRDNGLSMSSQVVSPLRPHSDLRFLLHKRTNFLHAVNKRHVHTDLMLPCVPSWSNIKVVLGKVISPERKHDYNINVQLTNNCLTIPIMVFLFPLNVTSPPYALK
jgi:hypothetical protein